MKRLFACLLAFVLILSVLPLSLNAVSDELIANGTFESEDISAFVPMNGGATLSRNSTYKYAGSYSLRAASRASGAGAGCNVSDQLALAGGYGGTFNGSVYIRLQSGSQSCRLVLSYLRLGAAAESYITGGYATVSTSWTNLTLSGQVWGDITNLVYAYLYVEVPGTTNFYLDNFSLVKDGTVNGAARPSGVSVSDISLTHNSVASAARTAAPTVGVIRWDAWYGHSNLAYAVCNQVETTLSPAKYHFRAPFYADVTNEGGIQFSAYTQEVFDQEMRYAKDAGIDYFIYNWYDDAMRMARVFHQNSAYKNDVKLCVCISGVGTVFQQNEIRQLVQEDYYMTVLGGRPLFYMFLNADSDATEAVRYYRAMCRDLGLQDPYFVTYNKYYNSSVGTYAMYADATAHYAVQGYNGETFAKLVERSEGHWAELKGQSNTSDRQFVPTVTAGWHALPRYENPTTWASESSSSYSQYGTAEEIAEHLDHALAYLCDPANAAYTKANTVSIYAWNEHDEGGWICPTIAVDNAGNQLYNEDGSKKINTERLDAIKAVIMKYKQGASHADAGNLYINFETGAASDYLAVDGGTVSNSNTQAQGQQSAYFTGGTQLFHGVKLKKSVVDTVTGGNGGTYVLQADYYFPTTTYIRPKAYVGTSALMPGGAKTIAQQAYEDGFTASACGYIYGAQQVAAGGTWTTLTFTLNIPTYFLTSNAFTLYLADDGGQKSYYIDNIILYPADQIAGARLELGTDLTLHYYAMLNPVLARTETVPVMRFTRSERVQDVDGVYNVETGLWSFTYTGITPQCMTDPIDAQLYVKGRNVDTRLSYSVASYCQNLASRSAGELGLSEAQAGRLKTLLADLLVYGTESQRYKGYRTGDLASAGKDWVDAYKSTFRVEDLSSVRSITAPVSANDKLTAAGLYFAHTNRVYFLIATDRAASLTVTLRREGVQVKSCAVSELEQDESGKYVLWTDDIAATEYGDTFTAILSDGGNELQRVTYSVDSYTVTKHASGTVGALVRANSNYGRAAIAYRAAMMTDSSFRVDLSEEDTF